MKTTTVRYTPTVTRNRLLTLLLSLLLLAPAAVRAGEFVEPDPGLSAREVVEIQLDALKALDREDAAEQVLQVWAMAHPANKAYMGSLARFGAMLRSPGYNSLIGHGEHSVLAARAAADVTEFYVTVKARNGATSAYVWVMQKVAEGENAGCWMTVAVSPAVRINRAA